VKEEDRDKKSFLKTDRKNLFSRIIRICKKLKGAKDKSLKGMD
jgi:hypothetical protein